MIRLLFFTILARIFLHSCWAQDLAPRAYLITPLHSNAINLTYSFYHGGLDFNGYQNGGMTITVPVGWQVVVHFTNANDLPHSAIVLAAGADKQAAPSTSPVFAGAATKNPGGGLPKGAKETFTFEASKAGTYELVCAVPGHAQSGMWAKLIVSPTATAPSVSPAGAASLTVTGN